MKKWECLVCGYIHEGEEPPDECPICGAGKDQFVELQEPGEKTASQEASPPESAPTKEQPSPAAAPVQQEPAPPAEEPQPASLLQLIRKLIIEHHLHPIAVHSPNGIIPVAFLFMLLSIMFSSAALENAAFFNMIVVLLSMPLVLFTGYTAWQAKYRFFFNRIGLTLGDDRFKPLVQLGR